MKTLLLKYAALGTALMCGALIVPRADPATLSLSYGSSVTGYDLDDEFGIPHIVGTDSCSESWELGGLSPFDWFSCDSSMYRTSASAGMRGEVNDVYGEANYWASVWEPDFGGSYPFGFDPEAHVGFHLDAGGFFYIAAPASSVDIAFTAVDCYECYGLTVNGITGSSAFENIPTFTAIPYRLQAEAGMWTDYGGTEWPFSYDLRSVTITDPVSGKVLDSAEIRFGVVPIPEPGAAALCCVGLAVIAWIRICPSASCRRFTRT